MIRITALMDNIGPKNRALAAEHGLSLLLETPACRVLFDCGQSGAAAENARRLGRDLRRLDAVVLSHSHYDHAAGYRDLLEKGLGAPLLVTGSRFFEPKFETREGRYTDLSCGFGPWLLREHGVSHREICGAEELFPGLYAVSGFPRTHAFETVPERFVRLTEAGFVPDDFPDEVCLALDLGETLCVLCGCAHPGVLNMVSHCARVLGKPVSAVYGGTHLCEADPDRVAATVAELRALGLKTVGFSHCSGPDAEAAVRADPALAACHLAVGDCVFPG